MPYQLAYVRQYDPYYTYSGDAHAISFETLDAEERAQTYKWLIEQWAESNGLEMIQLIIEDEVVLDLDLIRRATAGLLILPARASRYKVYILFRGTAWSIIIPALLAVLGVGVYGFFTWKAEEVRFGPSKAYYEAVQTVVDVYSGQPEKAEQVLAAIKQNAPKTPEPSPGPIGEVGDLVKWGAIGLGVFVVAGLMKKG